MKKFSILIGLFSILLLESCAVFAFLYGTKRPIKNEDFEYFDKNFEIHNQDFLNTTKLRFDGFYFREKEIPNYGKRYRLKKFFKNGMVNEGGFEPSIEKIGSRYNDRSYVFGWMKIISNIIYVEIKDTDFPKDPDYIKCIAIENGLIEINASNDTIKYDFYFEPKASEYPIPLD